jgi:hypothetical protein
VRLPDGWIEHPIYRSGQKVAFFLVKENEIHCLRLNDVKGKWLTHQALKQLTRPIFKQYGHLITKVRQDNHTGHRFVTRLGFAETSRDETNIYYRAERLNHARL